jgi:hemin uptake protein HemP
MEQSVVPKPVAAARDSTPIPAPPARISSAQLLAGAREVEIDHHGAVYRLKQTSLGKLILTK